MPAPANTDSTLLRFLVEFFKKDLDETKGEVRRLGLQIEALRDELNEVADRLDFERLPQDALEVIARRLPRETINEIRRRQWEETKKQQEAEPYSDGKSQVELTHERISVSYEAIKKAWAVLRWLLVLGSGALAGHLPEWIRHVIQR